MKKSLITLVLIFAIIFCPIASPIKGEASDLDLTLNIANSKFPTKTYETYSFPAGNYEALKITIGEGTGENWWCVMFPPLCFTNSSVEFSDDAVETLKQNLTDEEYELISQSNKSKIKIKFKLLEWLNK